MILFILGLMLGCCLGVFMMAMMITFKKSDEAASKFLEERERIAHEGIPLPFSL